jgi:putative inorganic carbon (HCO3(-)) transporter
MGMGLTQFVPLVVYAAILLACVMSVFWKPQIGIYIIIPLLPFQVLRERLEEFPLGSHVVYLLLLSVIVGLFLRSELSVPRTPLNKALLVSVVFLYLSMWRGAFYLSTPFPIFPTDPRFAVWKDYMAMPLLFVATLGAIRTRSQIKLVFLIVCLSVLMVDRSALLNVLSHNFAHFDEGKRDGGPLGYAGSNGLAAFEAQCSCFLLGFVAYEKRRLRKLALYGLIAVTVYCLLYSFSRGGYLAFLSGLLIIGLLKKRRMIIVVLVVLLSWQSLVPLAVQERITMTYNKDDRLEESADQRVQLWTDAVQLITSYPVMGTGFVTYMYMGRVGQLRDTHNLYVKVLVETGIIGMFLFMWLLARLFTIGFRLFRTSKDPFNSGMALGLLSLFASLVVANLFGDRWTYIEINGVVWVLFALAAQACLLESSEATATAEIAAHDHPAQLDNGFSGEALPPIEA